ncbi:hypothetical protein BHM03_00016849 [Ensete ventricosum]|nr:hypothetical protein BHM03_00016849 [Ensete ventricosum]
MSYTSDLSLVYLDPSDFKRRSGEERRDPSASLELQVARFKEAAWALAQAQPPRASSERPGETKRPPKSLVRSFTLVGSIEPINAAIYTSTLIFSSGITPLTSCRCRCLCLIRCRRRYSSPPCFCSPPSLQLLVFTTIAATAAAVAAVAAAAVTAARHHRCHCRSSRSQSGQLRSSLFLLLTVYC